MASEDTNPTVKAGCLRLYLLSDNMFFLEIPVVQIDRNCLSQVKYLKYLAFAILGLKGHISRRSFPPVRRPQRLADGDNLTVGACYQFAHPGAKVKGKVNGKAFINLRVALTEARSLSTTNRLRSRDGRFKMRLQVRDGDRCVFTGNPMCQGHHIIPFCKGNEALQIIKNTRPAAGQQNANVAEIEDPRNGFLCDLTIHACLTSGLAVLPTPNPILSMADIPARRQRNLTQNGTPFTFPTDRRFTLQFLSQDQNLTDAESHCTTGWQGQDAAFSQAVPTQGNYRASDDSNENGAYTAQGPFAYPSEWLLTYAYGSAAVKCWGSSHNIFKPSIPPPEKKAKPVKKRPSRLERVGGVWKRLIGRDEKTGGDSKMKGKGKSSRGATQLSGGIGAVFAVPKGHPPSDSGSEDDGDLLLQFSILNPEIQQRLVKAKDDARVQIMDWQAGVEEGI
ncbi:hypothetical protein B0H12DRAFT_1228667 [Mycena haematopus]|nr:hypothetical protein B0H12DRAFT_1228667 [Mycena haematopus]